MVRRHGYVRVLVVWVALAVTAVGCGDSDDPPAPPVEMTGADGEQGEIGEAMVADPSGEQVTSPAAPIGPDVQTQGADGLPVCENMDVKVTQETLSVAGTATVCLINKLRRRRGMRGLEDSAQLRQAAAEQARDMVSGSYFSHVSPNGRSVSDRVRAAGYLKGYQSWRLGENLGWGTGSRSTPASIVQAWMGSPGHRKIMLDRGYRDAGLAVVYGSPVGAVSGPAGTYVHVLGVRSK